MLLTGCGQSVEISDVEFNDLNGEISQIDPAKNRLSVIYFLSPECPLCINYTLAFREISSLFSNDSVRFYGIHSGQWFSANEVEEYQLKYDLDFEMLLDNNNTLAENLGASVTPQVFVLTSNSEVLYSGKIDNWVNELGKKKLEVSEHYLKDALTAFLEGKSANPNKTEPVGCLIE